MRAISPWRARSTASRGSSVNSLRGLFPIEVLWPKVLSSVCPFADPAALLSLDPLSPELSPNEWCKSGWAERSPRRDGHRVNLKKQFPHNP